MFAALLALAAPALATIYTTNPVAHTQAYGGQVLTIDWVDDGQAPNLQDIGPCSIDLCIGSETDQRCVQNLGESVDVSAASSISTTIDPKVGENGKYYFIRYRSLGLKEDEYPYQQYSARFYLNSMEGNFEDDVKQLATSSTDDFIWATGSGASGSTSGSATSGTATGAAAPSGATGATGAAGAAGAAVSSGTSGTAVPSGSGKAVADASSSSTSTRTSTTASRASASASPSPSANSGVAKFAAPGLFTLAACLAAYVAI